LKIPQQNFNGGPSESKQKAGQKAEAFKAVVCNKKLIKSEPNIPKRFSCQQCDKTFDQKHFLKIHNKINHVKKIALKVKEAAVSIRSEPQYFTCLECDKTFESAKHLKIHDKINHAKLSSQLIKKEPRALANNCFQCSQCDKTFANRTYLKIHVTMKHKNKDSSEQINSDPKNEIKTEPEVTANNCFQCPECDRNFASPVHLKIHFTMKHTTVNQNDSFAEVNSDVQENSLMQSKVVPNEAIQQIKSDPQGKPVDSSLCDKTFADPKFLKIHFTMKHTTDSQKDSSASTNSDPLDKTYPCPFCDKCFAEPSHLKRHNTMKHLSEAEPQDRPYNCSLCEKSYTDSGNLNRHIRIKHTSEAKISSGQVQAKLIKSASKKDKPFKCSQCNKSFAKPSHLKRHVDMKHNEPEVPTFSHGIFGDIVPMDILGV